MDPSLPHSSVRAADLPVEGVLWAFCQPEGSVDEIRRTVTFSGARAQRQLLTASYLDFFFHNNETLDLKAFFFFLMKEKRKGLAFLLLTVS